jgi:hypothetical protein
MAVSPVFEADPYPLGSWWIQDDESAAEGERFSMDGGFSFEGGDTVS